MSHRVKIKCAKCGKTGMMDVSELKTRVDDDRRPLCTTCCKEKRWESPACKNCSDRVTCVGAWREKIKQLLDKTGGV